MGEFVEHPRRFQNSVKKLRVAQRSVSRKQNKRSDARRKAVRVVAKLHRKVNWKTFSTLDLVYDTGLR
jgi:putative transposase